MASNASDDPTSLTCGLCNETYQYKDGPLILPCLHSFCKPCLSKYIVKEKSTDKKMTCPTCNASFPHPKSVDNFPINLRLAHMTESSAYKKQAKNINGNVKCQKCEGTSKDATTFCCNHRKFLCSHCKHLHQLFLDEEDHVMIDIATYQKGEFKIHPHPPKCPQHKEKLVIFCNKCKELICLYCAQTEHQDHEKSSVDKTSESEKAELQNLMSGVDEALGKLDQSLQQIQEMREKVKVCAEKATARIDKACNDLIQAVEDKRKILQRKCREIAKGKDDVLLNQMVELEHLRKDLSYAKLHANDAINNYSPEEVLSVKKVIQHQLSSKMELYQQKSMELREDDTINTSLQIDPLVEEVRKFGFFPNVPDPLKCHVEGLVAPQATVGKEKQVTVVLEDETGDPVQGKAYFQYQLRMVANDPDQCVHQKASIEQSNKRDGITTLRFTPDRPGEYQLTVMVRNRPIANPYKIIARHHRDYKGFGNIPVTYKNVGGYCHGVAVDDNGTIYATDISNNTIKVFRPDGTEGQIGGPDEVGGGLSSPTMLAIQDDVIYVVNNQSHMVKMYSTEGRFIGRFGGYGSGNGQFNYPWGICTDEKGRILVADYGNNRIQVFTSKGNFIMLFPCSGCPYDIAVDPEGNFHVALSGDNDIAVYSQDGRQIKTYNLGGKLQGPRGIYIDDGGNRIISAYSSKEVHITDAEGKLISTRWIEDSWGITMDRNGVIYVAEYTNNRVSIYRMSSSFIRTSHRY